MRRKLCLLLILLFLLPTMAQALREPDHIGIAKAIGTTPQMIVRGDAKVWVVSLTGYDGAAWLTLYDDYLEAGEEENIILEIEVADATSKVVILNYPIDVSNGLYAHKSIGTGTYLILYEY